MADTKISAMTAVTVPALTDTFPIIQGGANYKETNQQVKDLLLGGAFYTTGEITPSALTSSQNDWNPTGLATCTHINVSTDNSSVAITGITAPATNNTILTLYNAGTTNVLFPHESTSSAAANRFKLSKTVLSLQPGHSMTLSYETSISRWVEVADTSNQIWIADPRTKFVYVNDFMEAYAGNTALNIASGTGTTPVNSTYGIFTQKAVGAWQITTGSTSTGRSGLTFMTAGTAFTCALGRHMSFVRVGLNTLSTVAEEFSAKVGGFFGIAVVPGSEVDGICWAYDRTVDGNFWVCISSNNSSRTKTVTAVPVTTNYIWLGIITNDDWTVVEYIYSNDAVSWTRAAIHKTALGDNIPTSARSAVPMIANTIKSNGSTARIISIDAVMYYYKFLRA